MQPFNEEYKEIQMKDETMRGIMIGAVIVGILVMAISYRNKIEDGLKRIDSNVSKIDNHEARIANMENFLVQSIKRTQQPPATIPNRTINKEAPRTTQESKEADKQ